MNSPLPHTPEILGDEALALDYALGILVEPELSLALRRIDEDAGFALLVSRYRAQLMIASIGHDAADDKVAMPSLETWQAILARISQMERP